MVSIPPLLRLPTEIRLRIAVDVIGDGPDPRDASKFSNLEALVQNCIDNRYAIFDIPGFALNARYPRAFKQSEAVIVIPSCQDFREHRYFFFCFDAIGAKSVGEANAWPATRWAPTEWLIDGIKTVLYKHMPTPPIASGEIVKLITDEVHARKLATILSRFLENFMQPDYKTLKLCILVHRERDKWITQDSDRIYQILSTETETVRKGVKTMLWLFSDNLPDKAKTLKNIELEIHDQHGTARRVLRVAC